MTKNKKKRILKSKINKPVIAQVVRKIMIHLLKNIIKIKENQKYIKDIIKMKNGERNAR